MKERPLVVFALAEQAAVGVYAVLAGLQVAAPGTAVLGRRVLLALALLALAGMAASLGHLGRPRRAYRALWGLRSSWLSREILAALLFASGLAAQTGVAFLWGAARVPVAVVAAVALAGLGLVYCMARAYMLRTVAPWDTPAVLLSFLATTLVLGSVGALLLVPGAGVQWLLAGAALADVGVGWWRLRAACRPRYGEIRAAARPGHGLQAIHAGLLALGVAWAAWALDSSNLSLVPALLLALAAEVANRVQFYRV